MAKPTPNYQQLRARLQAIVDWFESDEVDLEAAIAKYDEAAKLIAEIEKYLQSAKTRITKLTVIK